MQRMITKRAMAGSLVLTAVTQAVMAQTQAPAPEQDQNNRLDLVTITATKREERLQDLPAAATVVQAQQLEQQRITSVSDLSRSAATVSSTGNNFSIRGFGSSSFTLSAEGSVGILVDGVALAGAGSFPPNLFDVERVEILEGPQGTLFGRNANAGVINIVTKAPSTKAFGGSVRVDLMNRDANTAQLALNVPINDTLAFRVSGSLIDSPKLLHNLPDDTWVQPRNENARLRMLWKPTADLKVNLIAETSITKPRGGAQWSVYISTPGSTLTSLLSACGVTVQPENTDTCVNPSNVHAKTSVEGYSGQVDWQLGDYTLTSVTALRKARDYNPDADLDSIALPAPSYTQPNDLRHRNVSQEFRVVSPDYDWGNYVAGVYFFKGDINQDITALLKPGPALLGQRSLIGAESKSSAAFSQFTYKVAPKVTLNLGLRLGHDDVSADRVVTLAAGAVAPFSSLTPVHGSTSHSYASWRVGAQYELTRQNMIYSNYARGYKGPAVNDNATSPSVPLIVDPEVPKTFEIGMKNQFLGGRVGVNLAAWHTKIQDFQAQVYDASTASFVFSNAPAATNKGVSVDVYGMPAPFLKLNGGLAYVEATYGAGYKLACAQGSPAGCQQDATGAQINGVPRLRATLAANYLFDVLGYRGTAGADVAYSSKQVLNPQDPLRNLDARTTVGARLGLRSADDKWGVALFARNLFDQFQPTNRFGNLLSFVTGDSKSYVQLVGPESRRTIGLSIDATF